MISSRIFRVTGPPGTGILAANAVESVAQRATPRDCNRRGHGNEEVTSMQGDCTRVCPFCEQPFVAKRHAQVYCSRRCAGITASRATAQQRGDTLRGRGKGGYYITRDGKREHRFVMEQMIGRALRPDEHVHHIDGDRFNNAPENLQLLSASEHMLLHAAQRRAAAQRPCCIEGCDKPSRCHDMCGTHYQHWRIARNPVCSVDGCPKHSISKGLCPTHYEKQRRGGDAT